MPLTPQRSADTPGSRHPRYQPRLLNPNMCQPRPVDWYPLFPNPVVAESLLDRLINTSHQVFMNGPSYRPNKRPGRVVPTGKEDIR